MTKKDDLIKQLKKLHNESNKKIDELSTDFSSLETFKNNNNEIIDFLNNKKYLNSENLGKNIYKDTGKKITDYSNRNQNPNDILIQIRDVKKSYDSSKLILKGINLDVYKGDRLAIMGHNGCGKTTLLNIILGYFQPSEGSIYLNKVNSTSDFLKNVGVQFQKANYFRTWKIDEAIDFVMKLSLYREGGISYKEWFYTKAVPLKEQLIDFFMLNEKRNVRISKMSGGEQQKLNLILSLIKKPKILILDEFTTGLDLTFKEKTIDFLDTYISENDITLIVISHIKEEVERLAERIVIIDNGVIKNDVMIKDLLKDGIGLTKYLNHYFVNEKFIEKYRPQELSKISSQSTKYQWSYYKPSNPWKKSLVDDAASLSGSDFLGNKTEITEERKIQIDNSPKAYRKLLIGDWLKTGGWVLPILIFVSTLLVFSIGIYNLSWNGVSVSQLQGNYAAIASAVTFSSSLFLILVWGQLIFKVKGTMTLKRIQISNSNKNDFVTYGFFTSLFWYFLPFLILFGIFSVLVSSNVMYDGVLVVEELTYINQVSDGYTNIETNFVAYSGELVISSADLASFFGSNIVNYFMSIGFVLLLCSIIKSNKALFWVSVVSYMFIVFGTTILFIPYEFLIGNSDPYNFSNTNPLEVQAGINFIESSSYNYYYRYSSGFNLVSSLLVFGGPVNVSGISFLSMGNYAGVDNNTYYILYWVLPIIFSVGSISYGIFSIPKWTNN